MFMTCHLKSSVYQSKHGNDVLLFFPPRSKLALDSMEVGYNNVLCNVLQKTLEREGPSEGLIDKNGSSRFVVTSQQPASRRCALH